MNFYVTQATSNLINLSQGDLRELLNDDLKLDERVQEATKSLEAEKEQLMNENRKVAEENLEREPEMIERRARINSLSEEGIALCTCIQEKLDQIKEKSGDLTEDTMCALLETSAAESEESSEKIVRQFLDKDLSVDTFLENFMDIRKVMHLRKFKADKMKELIRNPRVDQPMTTPYPMIPGGLPPMMMPTPGMYKPY